MSERVALLAAAACFGLAACTSDKVVGRYNTAICEDDTASGSHRQVACESVEPTAIAFAQSFATPGSTGPPSVTGLSDRGQAAYVEAAARVSKDLQSLRSGLAAPIAAASPNGSVDRSTFHRTIVVTVRRAGGFNPADRLEATDVIIHLPDARFDSWDTVATAYTTINAGSVSLAQTHGLTEALSAGTPSAAPASASLSLGGSQSGTRTETVNGGGQIETLTATVEGENGHDLHIHRQGGYGIDLTGNTVIKVDIDWDPQAGGVNLERGYTFSATTRDGKGRPLPLARAKLTATRVIGLPAGKSVAADVSLTYTMRHVLRGASTYEEKDDDVIEHTVGPIRQPVDLVPPRDASPPGFAIYLAPPDTDAIVEASLPGAKRPIPLCFGSYANAGDFLTYLKSKGDVYHGPVGGIMLGLPGLQLSPLTPLQVAGAYIRDRC